MNKLRYLHRDYARDHAMSVRAKLTCIQPKNIVDPAARSEQSIKLNNLFYQIASSADLEATFINFDAKVNRLSFSLTKINVIFEKMHHHYYNCIFCYRTIAMKSRYDAFHKMILHFQLAIICTMKIWWTSSLWKLSNYQLR